MKDPKKESNKPDEANRLVEVADKELDSVAGGYETIDCSEDSPYYGFIDEPSEQSI